MTFSRNASPAISVIIPVLNEGPQIDEVLMNLQRAARAEPYEVIIVDGDAQASTLRYLEKSPGVINCPVRGMQGPMGRGSQMNAGVAEAKGHILLFLHADTQLPDLALQTIRTQLDDPEIVAGAFNFEIRSPSLALTWVARLASLRSQLTRIPYGDQAIFMRRQTFLELNGYPDIPIMEDIALMRKLRASGQTIRILHERVQVSSRRWDQEGIIFCTLRNWALLSLYSLGVSPHQLVTWYPPHTETGRLQQLQESIK